MTLKGKLENFGLGELLQTLALNQHTGTLLLSREGDEKKIYFSTGSITLLSTSKTTRIGELLMREGLVTEAQLEQASQEQQSTGRLFGKILVDYEWVTHEDVQRAVRNKVEEEIYDLFLWPDGRFEFLSDFCPAELMDPLQRYTQISIDPNSVIMEGLRQLDEFQSIRESIPDSRMVIACSAEHAPAEEDVPPEQRSVWRLVPSQGSIDSILDNSPTTRFYTMAFLNAFLQQGWIQVLSPRECRAHALALRKQGHHDRAADVYEYICESDPDSSRDSDFLRDAGLFLADTNRKASCIRVLTLALEACQSDGDHSSAWLVGSRLLEIEKPSLELREAIWESRSGGTLKSVQSFFAAFTESLSSARRFDDLARMLEQCRDEFGRLPSYWIHRGDAQRELGLPSEAAECYERSANLLDDTRDTKEVVRLLRIIFDLDPNRSDVARRLQNLLELQERHEARKRRRFTLAGLFLIIGLAGLVYPIYYELSSRREWERAQLLEVVYALDQESLSASAERPLEQVVREFEDRKKSSTQEIRQQYDLIILNYPWSSRSKLAESALRRLEEYERGLAIAMKTLREQRETEEAARRQFARDRLEELQKLAADAESTGDYQGLRDAQEKLLADASPLLDLKSIRFPLWIESDPPGATVTIGDREFGKTPVLYRFTPRSKFTIRFERSGCETTEVAFHDNGRTQISVELERKPVQRLRFPAVGNRVLTDGTTFFIPSRDGWVTATPANELAGHEAGWRRQISFPGYSAPWICPVGGDILASASSGSVERIDPATGEARWSHSSTDPITACAVVGEKESLVAYGTVTGSVVILSSADGRVVGQVQGTYPVEHLAFDGSQLNAVNRRQELIRYTGKELSILSAHFLPAPVAALLPDGSILDVEGTVHHEGSKLEKQFGRLSSPAAVRQGHAYFCTEEGEWIHWQAGRVERGKTPVVGATPPIPIDTRIYFGGRDGRLYCLDRRTGAEEWSMQINAEIADIAPAEAGWISVFLSAGGILRIEGKQ